MNQRILIPDNRSGRVLAAATSRRGFLRSSLAAGLTAAASAAAVPLIGGSSAFAEDDRPVPPGDALAGHGRAKRAILIFLVGGASHIDTFDPKPGRATGGPFKTVKTRIPGVHFSEHLPLLAERMMDLAVIRGMTSSEGNHTRARTLMHTAYPPEATVKHPTFGSAVSCECAPDDFDLPNFVTVGQAQDDAAFLGVKHAPFAVNNRNGKIDNLAYHPTIGKERVERRLALLGDVQGAFAKTHGHSVTAGQDEMFRKAKRMADSPLTSAFDISNEDDKVRGKYGSDAFGQGCLMARRLVESGVSCVEVGLGGWDTHDDNFTKVEGLARRLDTGLSALLDDLKSRGLLDSTLVACFGDFGRTPKINERNGRDHWSRAFSAVVAGGGVLGGQVIGETDADGAAPKDRPVSPADLHASFWHSFGVDPWKEYLANDRPITLTPKEGKIVRELFV